MRENSARPPAVAQWILKHLLPERDHLMSELEALFQIRLERDGPKAAKRWYWRQFLRFGVNFAADGIRRVFEVVRPDPTLLSEFKYSARRLMRRPGYLVASVLTLGIGVGGVTTVYSAANWVLLRPVPGVPDPDRLVELRLESNESVWPTSFAWPISNPDLQALEDLIPSVESLAGVAPEEVHVFLGEGFAAQRVPAQVVTPNYFDVIGNVPLIGRFFDESEQGFVTGPRQVVLGFEFWRQGWRNDPRAVGQVIQINGHEYEIIGVAQDGFMGAELPGSTQMWLPASSMPLVRPEEDPQQLTNRSEQLWDQTIGAMVEGATVTRVEDEANAAMEQIRRDVTGGHSFLATHFVYRAYHGPGLSPWIRAKVDRTLVILAGSAGLLLLLAIANVTNLSLARVASRRGEVAIRRALGSGSWRASRDPLLEALMIGGLGAGAAVAVAAVGITMFGDASLSSRGGSLAGMELDWRVVGVAAVVAFGASLFGAVIPTGDSLKTPHSLTAGEHTLRGRTPRVRAALVVAQVALSAVLVVGAGLLVKSALNIQSVDLGVDIDNLISFSVEPGLEGYEPDRHRAKVGEIHASVSAEADVQSVGFMFPRPLTARRITAMYRAAQSESARGAQGSGYDVTPGTLTTMGFDFLAGNDIRGAHSGVESQPGLVIINESAARALFPESDPRAALGRAIYPFRGEPRTVIGVVADARLIQVKGGDGPVFYRVIDDISEFEELIAYVRVVDEGRGLRAIPTAVKRAAPTLPIYGLDTARGQVRGLLSEQRLVARLAAVMGIIGLLLAGLGLYAVLAYAVIERTREIGVRGALGATPRRILGGVVLQGLVMTAIGVLIGVPAVYWTVQLIESQLYEVSSLDAPTYAVGVMVLVVAAVLSSALPGLRAVRISPAEALKSE